jgi:hypothetical protein
MIDEFVKAWDARKGEIEAKFRAKHPDDYKEIVRNVIEILTDGKKYSGNPDPKNIHEIDDGDYQGTLVYVIPEEGYQPDTYWYVKVFYGSCSGCDTLQAITGYSNEPPTEKQVKEYMMLALHIVQGLKKMGETE